MSERDKCARCKRAVEHIDNIMGTSHWGLIQKKAEVTTRNTLRVAMTSIRHGDERSVIRADDDMPLCDPCMGLLVGFFLQGREVVPLDHPHDWRQMSKFPILDRCGKCYQTRFNDHDDTEKAASVE